jgi:hypothetical protein
MAANLSFSQSGNGEIKGTIKNEKGELFPGVSAVLESGGMRMDVSSSDREGRFHFTEVAPGTYEIRASFIGYTTILKTGINVAAGKTNYIGVSMEEQPLSSDTVVIYPEIETIAKQTMSTGKKIEYMDIKLMAADKGKIPDIIVNQTPGILPSKDGKELHSRGAREKTTQFFLDGDKTIGSLGIPSQAILGMTVYTGGIPAAYGDLTGGLVLISTKSYFTGMAEKRKMIASIEENRGTDE